MFINKHHLIGTTSFICMILLALTSLRASADDAFPLRGEFADVPVIGAANFRKRLAEVTVVDVRSSFEYHILRVTGAVNIPVSDRRFKRAISKLRKETGKPLVFYCNGMGCRKSYMAGRFAQHAGLKDSLTYDGGIAAWAKENPELTELLGTPLNSVDRLIEPERLAEHMLSPEDFLNQVNGSVVIDIRSPLERAGLALFVGRERAVALENRRKLDRQIQKALDRNVPLLAYDASGRDVPWLQYYLEETGLEQYWFMDGGAQAFFRYLETQP